MLNIETVTVCVGYGDFLLESAKLNRPHFERWVIVTAPQDEETREVCRKYDLSVVLTDDFTRDGADFAKARGINRGLNLLSKGCWRLHLDADIVLPLTFLKQLDAAHLEEDCIYGFDRVMVKNYEAWERLQLSGYLAHQHDYHYRTNLPKGVEVGTRWVSMHDGWVPIGFAQLFHSSADEWRGVRFRRYPEKHGDAARCDVQFALQWDRRHRILIPEIVLVHLESEPAPLGANWNGRTTKPFKKEKKESGSSGVSGGILLPS